MTDPADTPAPGANEDSVPVYPSPLTVTLPEGPPLPLICASPHSGKRYPERMISALCVPLIDLKRTEDAFIDELLAPASQVGATVLAAYYARGFVDLNRHALELDPAMFEDGPPRVCGQPGPRVQAGLGSLPRVGARGTPIYARKLSRAEGEARLRDVHDVYHRDLNARLEALRSRHGEAFLIDWHSMPSVQPGRRRLPDVVLGDRFGSSCCSRLTSAVERAFRRLGYSVVRNAPYAGGYTTRRYGRPRQGLHALQVEVRRDLYLDELRVEKTSGFSRLARDIADVLADVATFIGTRGVTQTAAE